MYYFSFIFLLVLRNGLSNGSHYESRIVNGTDAGENEFPFAVSLRRLNRHTCGSTILNENFILTAAHCVCVNDKALNPDQFSIQYGLTEISAEPINTIKISKIYCNKFNEKTLIHDCAVLKLADSLPSHRNTNSLDKSVKIFNRWESVVLDCDFDSTSERDGLIIGWGKVAPEGPLAKNLQKVAVEIYKDEDCEKNFDMKHHICFGAKNAGACNGDSGTALLVDGAQTGIASFINAKCGIANKDFPNIYSRVKTYCDWIEQIAGKIERKKI